MPSLRGYLGDPSWQVRSGPPPRWWEGIEPLGEPGLCISDWLLVLNHVHSIHKEKSCFLKPTLSHLASIAQRLSIHL